MSSHTPTAADIAARYPSSGRKGEAYTIPAVCHGSDDYNLNILDDGDGGIIASCKTRGCAKSTIERALGIQPARRSQSDTLIATYQHADGGKRSVHRIDAGPGDCTWKNCDKVATHHKHVWGRGSPEGCFLLLWNDRAEAAVVVVEGEKAASSLAKRGFTAASYKGGAGAAAKAIYTPVKNRDVIIWPDADDEGANAGVKCGEMCLAAGASSVRYVLPPADAKRGWDAADASSGDVEWMLAESHDTPDALIAAFPDAFLEKVDGDAARPDAATALADYGRTGNLLSEFGLAGKTPLHCVAWLIKASEGGIIAAYERTPPSGHPQDGQFYAKLRDGRISSHDDAIAPFFQRAATAFIGATAASGAKGKLEAIRYIQEKMLSTDGIRKLKANIALAVGSLMATDTMPKGAHVIDLADVDSDTRYLGVKGGVVDLETGELITDAVDRNIYVSRSTGVRYIPGAHHEAVDALLHHPTTSGKIIDFVLDSVGHALHRTPHITRRINVLLETEGHSGKSTLLTAIENALGDYGSTLKLDALQAMKRQPGTQTEYLAVLTEAAVVTTSEISGVELGAEQVKQFTGEAKIVYRRLFQGSVNRAMRATIFASANSVPKFRLDDNAMQQRYTPIPFQHIPFDPDLLDETLSIRLDSDAAKEALHALLIDRAVANRMPPPLLPEIERAKIDHRALLIGDDGVFIDARIEKGNGNDRLATAAAWQAWCEYHGAPPDTPANDRIGGKTKVQITKRISAYSGTAARQMRIDGKSQRGWAGLRMRFQSN